MTVELNVRLRQEKGRGPVRRLRRAGEVPAVLYGHAQENVNLAVKAADIQQIVTHGVKLVELRGEVNESALIREVQWDPFGAHVLHVDFFRVSAGERVTTTVPIVLRGEAPGSRAGGMVEHVLHEVQIECPVGSLPERIELSIQDLHVGGALHVRDLPLPAGAKVLADPDAVVVHCVVPRGVAEVAPAVAETAEPELVGKKAEAKKEEEE